MFLNAKAQPCCDVEERLQEHKTGREPAYAGSKREQTMQ